MNEWMSALEKSRTDHILYNVLLFTWLKNAIGQIGPGERVLLTRCKKPENALTAIENHKHH